MVIPRKNTIEFGGIYEVPEAARLLHVTMPDLKLRPQKVYSAKLIRWIRNGLAHKSLVEVPGRELLISFEDLISMRVIAFMRYLGYTFREIRSAESYAREITGHNRPLATERLWVERLGAANIYAEIEDLLAAANRGGQLAFRDLVIEGLVRVHNMTFDRNGIATAWTPADGINIDPKIQFGRPCIKNTRIPTSDVAGMHTAGDSIEYLSSSYEVSTDLIEAAINWEGALATEKAGD